MEILIDLDGTLTDTAHESFKPFKDGLKETDVGSIPLIKGAVEFIKRLRTEGHNPIIVSDSHTKYVSKISEQLFNCHYIRKYQNYSNFLFSYINEYFHYFKFSK